MHETVLLEREPALEWILGEAVQKVSRERPHGLVRLVAARISEHWAGDPGDVVVEKRRVYLSCGTRVLLEIDPLARRIDAWGAERLARNVDGTGFRARRIPGSGDRGYAALRETRPDAGGIALR